MRGSAELAALDRGSIGQLHEAVTAPMLVPPTGSGLGPVWQAMEALIRIVVV